MRIPREVVTLTATIPPQKSAAAEFPCHLRAYRRRGRGSDEQPEEGSGVSEVVAPGASQRGWRARSAVHCHHPPSHCFSLTALGVGMSANRVHGFGPPGASVGKFSVSRKSLESTGLTATQTPSLRQPWRGRATTPRAMGQVTYREIICFFIYNSISTFMSFLYVL
jgi:hypothetical protein